VERDNKEVTRDNAGRRAFSTSMGLGLRLHIEADARHVVATGTPTPFHKRADNLPDADDPASS